MAALLKPFQPLERLPEMKAAMAPIVLLRLEEVYEAQVY